MRILITAIHYPVCSARYLTRAFERLGHDVRHVGPETGRQIWGMYLPECYAWQQTAIEVDWQPDLIIAVDSAPEILDGVVPALVRQYGAPCVIFGVDNHVRSYQRDYAQHYFLAHRNIGYIHEPFTHVPCAYDPEYFTTSPIPFEDRRYDVACLGVIYPRRMQAIKALQETGFSVIWGTGLVYEAFAEAYQNSRISLCLSHNGDVAQRVFETAAMGNVVMTDDCADYPILKPNGFYLLDNTEPEHIVQAVKDVLHEPEHAQAMITQSMAWVSGQTWDARATEIVRWYERRTDGR